MIHGSMAAASAQIDKALADARVAGKFMAAVWMPDEQGNLICKKTTWQFPTERFTDAIAQLNQMLEDEKNPPRAPLPLAAFLKVPPVTVFPEDTPAEMDAEGGGPCAE